MEHSSWNMVDLAVLGVVLASGLLALIRGFVREAVALTVWLGASAAAVYLYPLFKPWVHHHIKTELVADAATSVGVFCAALVILIPLGHVVSGLVRGRALTSIDRSLGFVFGLMRGALVVCLLFLLTLWIWPDKEKEPDILAQAKTRPLMQAGAEVLKTFLPKEDMDKAQKSMNAVSQIPLDQITTPSIAGSNDKPNGEQGEGLSQQVIEQLINPQQQGKP